MSNKTSEKVFLIVYFPEKCRKNVQIKTTFFMFDINYKGFPKTAAHSLQTDL